MPTETTPAADCEVYLSVAPGHRSLVGTYTWEEAHRVAREVKLEEEKCGCGVRTWVEAPDPIEVLEAMHASESRAEAAMG